MIRKNLITLFAIAALVTLAMPSFAEAPALAPVACSAQAMLENLVPPATPAPLFLAGTCSGVCSTPSCLGAPVGSTCTKPFSGALGVCEFSGRVCSPGNQHCGCF
ncbi:MAG TPA: hypothetical protein VN851_15045 [Thermoanaerobaculia bacterium]|nr:hypothetical protein [Thermoanaerobaculia bacterium]